MRKCLAPITGEKNDGTLLDSWKETKTERMEQRSHILCTMEKEADNKSKFLFLRQEELKDKKRINEERTEERKHLHGKRKEEKKRECDSLRQYVVDCCVTKNRNVQVELKKNVKKLNYKKCMSRFFI